jgi:hypothetical protein
LRQGGRHGLDLAAVALEEAFEHLAHVLEQVPAVGHVHGIGCGPGCRLGVGAGAVAADDLDAGVVFEPPLQRRAVASREQVDDLAALQVDQDGAVALPLADRPAADAQRGAGSSRVAVCWTRRSKASGLAGIPSAPASRPAASRREGDGPAGVGQARAGSRLRRRQVGQPLAEGGARAVGVVAEELAGGQAERGRPWYGGSRAARA